MLLLPPNVPKDPGHWEFRTLPDGTVVRAMNDLIAMVINYKVSKNIPFNPVDPLGPSINQGLHECIDGNNAKDVAWAKAGQISDDFTPVNYAPQQLHQRSAFRGPH